ncbi:DUF1343 domain-containing protein [Leptospira semungkisensis]|uniref:DUF1343 domain-containing protein n=1 Tax=Leptospira semungkisensis TaxID=2484985 RepID=A0A4R9FRW1_9LEPT|nr:DUF1343 domain-containing protein [Leptospira semungkisensis]TGK00930.1 DUF1343 domain-containing protein [Leptospira semungkisensis]
MKKTDQLLKGSSIGMLTNQSAYGWKGDYHFRSIQKEYGLKKLFLPEHGLFAELQDQVSGSELRYDLGETQILNLYGDSEESLIPNEDAFQDLDTLLIDIRDVGARYYTFLTSALYAMQAADRYVRAGKGNIKVVVVDSPNPAGRKIEGSPLEKKFASFVGVEGTLHRHGLSTAGLLEYYKDTFSLDLKFHRIKLYSKKTESFLWVPPSPNIPAQTTCYVYAGLCLLEGTNLSEGRGTTRPFEIFGAPFIDDLNRSLLEKLEEKQKGIFRLRPLKFIPTFHKYAGQVCGGYQILLDRPEKFHSLLFGLHFVKTIRDAYPEQFEFLKGPYEFRSDLPAIQLLVGDEFLLEYLDGKRKYSEIKDYLEETERKWKKETRSYR